MSNVWNRRQFLTLLGGSMVLPSACQRVASLSPESIEARAVKRAAAFTIFDALIYNGKPNVGFTPIGLNDRRFFKTKERIQPDRESCQQLARETVKQVSHFVIDIEHWQVKGEPQSEVQQSIKKYLQIIDWMREAAPSLKLSVYSIPPVRDYWTPVRNHPAELAGWRNTNQNLKPIADAVDFLTPSLYTFYDDVPGWVKYARANIEEAQQFGKPVYPFLWCRYHISNRQRKNQFIEGDFWRKQLETVRNSGANGLVLWDWFGHDNPRTYVLDTRQAWWQETLKFKATLS